MSASAEIAAYWLEQLEAADVGALEARRMFGGVGIWVDGLFCALVAPGTGALYLKVDDTNRPDFEAEGAEPFRHARGTMSYWSVPEHVVEDPERLARWVRKAHAVARTAARGKAPKARARA